MPLKKKNKFRNKIIFLLVVALAVFLMAYVPKNPTTSSGGKVLEYELY